MKLIYFATIAFLICTGSLISQHKLSVSVKGGYNIPSGELKGDPSDSSDRANTCGIKNGFNIGVSGRYALDRKNTTMLFIGLHYNSFSGEGNYFHGNNVHMHNRINIFSISAGAAYSFLPENRIRPFLDFGLTTNFITGEKEEIVNAHSSLTEHQVGTTKTKLKSASRFGLEIGAGADLFLSRNIGAIAGVRYNLNNLIGKQYNTSPPAGEFYLNDKEYGSSPSKNINYIQIYAGISFYFLNQKSPVK